MKRIEVMKGLDWRELADKVEEELKQLKARSAFKKGARNIALELVDSYRETCRHCEIYGKPIPELSQETLLNGADNWQEYCEGGCALIYDEDIARALATPSELARTRDGELPPRGFNTWMSMQVHAHKYASAMIRDILVYGKW